MVRWCEHVCLSICVFALSQTSYLSVVSTASYPMQAPAPCDPAKKFWQWMDGWNISNTYSNTECCSIFKNRQKGEACGVDFLGYYNLFIGMKIRVWKNKGAFCVWKNLNITFKYLEVYFLNKWVISLSQILKLSINAGWYWVSFAYSNEATVSKWMYMFFKYVTILYIQ